MRHWYAVHTKPRHEHLAAQHLARQGYDLYLPLARERRPGRLGAELHVVPLFARYLFVRLDLASDNAAPIRSTVGCRGLVRFGERTPHLPQAVVDALRARADADGVIPLECQQKWQEGQRVRIESGPFEGLNGIYRARCGNERAIVLMHWLGAERAVAVPEGMLTAA